MQEACRSLLFSLSHNFLLAGSIVMTCHSPTLCSGQDKASEAEGSVTTWQQHCEAEAAKYVIEPVAEQDKSRKWTRIRKPVFSHANAIGHTEHGSVYVWAAKNSKPVAIMTVIVRRKKNDPWYDVHELQSLHDRPFSATYEGMPTWNPDRGGLRWNVIPDVPTPPKDNRRMQLQAKLLARKFSSVATMQGEKWHLRRMEKPLYQYNFKDADDRICSGAIYAYCRSTDPESMLVLEVRKDKSGEYRWHYAPFPFCYSRTTFSLNGKEVWSEAIGRKNRLPTSYHRGVNRNRNIRLAEPKETSANALAK